MSFPATGLESTYRNHMNDVAKLLTEKHPGRFLVFNLSERVYDISKLDNQVLDFGWPDHHAPPLDILFAICKSMHSWLKSDVGHVVVVHCKVSIMRIFFFLGLFYFISNSSIFYKYLYFYLNYRAGKGEQELLLLLI